MADFTASELFGEEYADFEVKTFAVKDGKGYYITEEVNDTRTTYLRHIILIRFNDGTEERTDATSEQELKLWTEHLA